MVLFVLRWPEMAVPVFNVFHMLMSNVETWPRLVTDWAAEEEERSTTVNSPSDGARCRLRRDANPPRLLLPPGRAHG